MNNCHCCVKQNIGNCYNCDRPVCYDHSWDGNESGPCLTCFFGNDYCYGCRIKVIDWKNEETYNDLIECENCGFGNCAKCAEDCPTPGCK